MPLEIRGAHFLIRSAQLVRGTRLEYALNDSSPSRSGMTRVCERGIKQFYLKMQSTRLSTSEITQINHTYLNSPAAELCHKFDRYSFPVRRIG